MAMLSARRLQQLRRLSTRRIIKPAGFLTAGRRLCRIVRASQPYNKLNETESISTFPSSQLCQQSAWQRGLGGMMAGFSALSFSLPAFAISHATDTSANGPSTDTLLSAGPDFSFTTLLLFTFLGYWLVKAAMYIIQHMPENLDEDKQKRSSGGSDLTDIGHAHIRSYTDSSQQGAGGDMDARDLRNARLARGAVYRVTATLKESQPRIHALVEELAGPLTQWPPLPPRNLDVDFVAAMVYNRMMQERLAKGLDYVLAPREVAVLETRLLEEVAERVASEQVAEFAKMAAQGKLNLQGPSSGGKD